MAANSTDYMLDNPVWYALNTYHTHLALGTDLAKRYPSEFGGFAGLADHSDQAYHDLGQLLTSGEVTVLFEAHPPDSIPGLPTVQTLVIEQMVSQQPVPAPQSTIEILELATADVPEMMALVELTHPGPFFSRTIEFGRFIGIRQNGQLVAMAGERVHVTGYLEVSAVCTHPDWQGKGYARLLCSILVNDIWTHGEVPFLHVFPGNDVARRLYKSMGFSKRYDINGLVVRHS